MTLRGKAAIVGIGEVPTRRTYPGRTTYSLCAEATRLAITDAGLRKEDIDGLVTRGSDISPMDLAEYLGLCLGFCEGVTQHGASGAHSVVVAASAIHAGLANTVLCVLGGSRDPAVGGFGPGIVRGLPPSTHKTVCASPAWMAEAATTTECAPLAPCCVTPSQNPRRSPRYSARSIGLMSEPRVTRPSMSSLRSPASVMARRVASAHSE